MDLISRNKANTWLRQAEYDLKAANLSYENDFFEWAAFQSEQSLEKGLKGLMVYLGIRPPKIHKIPILMHIINQKSPEFKDVELDFKLIESYTFISRYPFLIPDSDSTPHEYIKKSFALECIHDAEYNLGKIKSYLIRSEINRHGFK